MLMMTSDQDTHNKNGPIIIIMQKKKNGKQGRNDIMSSLSVTKGA